MILRNALLAITLVLLFAGQAHADCVNPDAEEAVLVYNTNYKTMQFCNGSQWIGMAGGIMPVLPGASMVDGWPDAISCKNTSTNVESLYYLDAINATGEITYRRLTSGLNDLVYSFIYAANGSYLTNENTPSFDCAIDSKTISQLYAEGKAFNLNGGGGSGGGGTGTQEGAIKGDGWPDALVCDVTGGTATGNTYVWHLAEPVTISGSKARYRLDFAASDGSWFLDYNLSDKAFFGFSSDGAAAGFVTDNSCTGKSIETLVADGNAKFFAATNSDNPLVGLSCSNGQVAQWSGTAWTCGTVTSGGSSVWLPGANTADIHYNGGNVGVWTDAPSAASPSLTKTLDVRGEGVFRGRVSLTQYDKNPTAGNATWHIDNEADRFRIFRQPDIATNGFPALQIDSDGKVGLGPSIGGSALQGIIHVVNSTTNLPIAHLSGTTGSNSWFQIVNSTTGNRGGISADMPVAGAVYLGSWNSVPAVLGVNNAEQMRIATSGNVGIGTNNPLAKLQVTAPTYTSIQATTASGIKMQILADSANNSGFVGPETAHDLRLGNANTEWMRIKIGGNVGIGTNNPERKLDVNTGTDYANISRNGGALGPVLQIGNDGCLSDINQGDAFGVTLCSDVNTFGSIKTNIISPSSREYKKAITPVTADRREEYLGILGSLDIKTYRYKKEDDDTEPHLGVIAEESPALILDRNDPKGLSSYDYTSLAVLGAQEALRLVRELKAENDALRTEFQSYKNAHP